MILLADSEGPDQTARMRTLIRALLSAYGQRHVFAWHGPFTPTDNQISIWYQIDTNLDIYFYYIFFSECCELIPALINEQ